MKKICIDCNKQFKITNFYLHRTNSKGIKSYVSCCKTCYRLRNIQSIINRYGVSNIRKSPFADKLRQRDKEYQRIKRLKNPQRKKRETLAYRKKYPEREIARKLIQVEIKSGRLKRSVCRDCDRVDTQGHHPDYSKPLNVIWLCPSHHKLEDLKLKVESNYPTGYNPSYE